jgi:lysozyme family protein
MVASSYDPCENRVLVHEGGYTNHPADPGGPTNFGITIWDARKFWKPGATADDVRAMPLSVAKGIYRAKYWTTAAYRCDDLPAGIDDSVFDYGVNSGVARAGKVLRRVLGLSDNAAFDAVLAALAKRDAKAVITAINKERLAFLRSLKTWPVFGAGWGRRVAEVTAFSLQLAAGAPVTMPAPAPSGEAIGKGAVPAPAGPKTTIGHTAGVGAAAAAAGLWPWIADHPWQAGVLAMLAILLVVEALAALERLRAARQDAPTPGLVPVPPAAPALA